VVLETALSGLRAIAREYPRQLRVLVRSAAPRRDRATRTGARGKQAEHSPPR
jgi:hypothetical protein